MKTKTPLLGFAILLLVLVLPVSAVSVPEAAFVSNATAGPAPLGILFIDESGNTPTTWFWSFGDGSTSTLKNPSHAYKNTGTYSVTLTATNSAGSNTITQAGYITVSTTGSTPVAAFVANVTSGTVPLPVLFVDTSTNSPTSWVWSFGDGGSSTVQNPVHTYAGAGTYSVTLTATNSAGSNTISQSGYITVTKVAATPVAAFVTTETSGGAPFTVQFVDASTNSPTSWVWSFGDGGTSTEQNPEHTYTSVGTYSVTLTATNAAGSDTTTKTDDIDVELSAPVTSFVADATSGTAPFTVNFTDTSTNSPTEWYWVFGDGSTSTAQNATHIYLTTGTYTVTLTAYNDEGSNKTARSDYITVTQSVTAPTASFSSDVTSGSAPMTVQFTDTSGYSPTAWVWTFGDGESSTLPNPSHTYSADGTYTVKLTASNTGGTNTVVRSGYVTVAAVTTSETVIPSTTIPESTATDTQGVSLETTTSGSASGESGGILPFAGVAVLVVIGIVAWIFLKRPPRGPHHSGGREL